MEESRVFSLQFRQLCYNGFLNLTSCNGNVHLMVGQTKISENTNCTYFALIFFVIPLYFLLYNRMRGNWVFFGQIKQGLPEWHLYGL